MTEYKAVYDALGLAPITKDVFDGRVELPTYADAPPLNYGFPPALIPTWSRDNPLYVGHWHHWFVERAPTWVRMYIDGGRHAVEVARNADQLVRWVLLESVTEEEEVGPRSLDFATAAGLEDGALEQIDAVSVESGDAFSGLAALGAFRTDPPARLVADAADLEYHGDFPVPGAPPDLERTCSLEFSPADRAVRRGRDDVPPWHSASDQAPVFASLLEDGDLEGAWLSLNSSGWTFVDAKKAAVELRERASRVGRSDSGFEAVLEAWLAQPHEQAGAF